MPSFDRFETVAIIGVGLIGGSMGLALKRKGFGGKLVGVDEPHVLERALNRGAIDAGFDNDRLLEAVAQADLVLLAMPIKGIIEMLQKIGPYIKRGALITDVGSTKRQIVETANIHLPSGTDFIGGHPMAGSEFRGVQAADPFLFENTIYVLTPHRPVDTEKRRAFGELLELIGAKVLLLQPRLHDEIAAAVSHLPQMVAVAMMNMVASKQSESPHFLKMAAGGFRDITRTSSSPFGIWEDIAATNSDMIVQAIDEFITELESIKRIIDHSNRLDDYFHEAAKNRLSIPKDTKGFLRPQYDISVSVEDKPGIIATLANALAQENVNIKDIEVLKIREDEGGTIRLAFSSENEQERALELIRKSGMECRKRG